LGNLKISGCWEKKQEEEEGKARHMFALGNANIK
jgi:hypothetical protein